MASLFPTERDGRELISRVSSKDQTMNTMNWWRSLDHIQINRSTCRNYGELGIDKSEGDDIPVAILGLPPPCDFFKRVWGKVPNFTRAKVTRWAKLRKEGPIAYEIRDYVKQVLVSLPIPIPAFFVNSVANVAIIRLAEYIVQHFRSVGRFSLLFINTRLITIIE